MFLGGISVSCFAWRSGERAVVCLFGAFYPVAGRMRQKFLQFFIWFFWCVFHVSSVCILIRRIIGKDAFFDMLNACFVSVRPLHGAFFETGGGFTYQPFNAYELWNNASFLLWAVWSVTAVWLLWMITIVCICRIFRCWNRWMCWKSCSREILSIWMCSCSRLFLFYRFTLV